MSLRTIGLSDALSEYILTTYVQESAVLAELRNETSKLSESVMQISPEQGQFMSLLTKLTSARRVIEVGVFTGYSSICVAKELPEDGMLIACDSSKEWARIAESYWEKASVRSKIDLRIAPAIETLQNIKSEYGTDSFDMVFIDADKSNYLNYYEKCLELVRPGGLILIDNTLWDGEVVNKQSTDEDTVSIQKLNSLVGTDPRVMSTLLTIGDGLTLAVKES
ncbi:MAG: O-methyltransferase [bacterium]